MHFLNELSRELDYPLIDACLNADNCGVALRMARTGEVALTAEAFLALSGTERARLYAGEGRFFAAAHKFRRYYLPLETSDLALANGRLEQPLVVELQSLVREEPNVSAFYAYYINSAVAPLTRNNTCENAESASGFKVLS